MGCVEALAGCPLSHGWRRASSPKGGAKSRLPLWGRCHAKGMTERAFPAAPAAHVRYPFAQERRLAAVPWRELSRAATHRELRTRALGGHQFSFLLLMIFDSSSMKLLISLNCRYTEANRT